jgi:hypothetical protein
MSEATSGVFNDPAYRFAHAGYSANPSYGLRHLSGVPLDVCRTRST